MHTPHHLPMTSCGHWIFYLLVLIFLLLPLLQLLSAPRLYRTLSFALAASATILERAVKHATHPCNTHTRVLDYVGLPVRWISRGGNLRTRGKKLTPRIRRTYRGCKKWVSYPATTKPKQRLDVVRQIWCEMQQQKERRELTSEDTTPVDINRASTEHVSTNPGLTDATSGEHRPGMGGEFVEGFTQQVGGGTPVPVSNPHAVTQQAPTIVTQQPPSARGCGRGIDFDTGRAAWLHLTQVAALIQLHNTDNKIRTTILHGVRQTDWSTLWTHMRGAEPAAAEGVGGARAQAGRVLRYLPHAQIWTLEGHGSESQT
jgi:hypothetical protein